MCLDIWETEFETAKSRQKLLPGTGFTPIKILN